MAFHSFFLFSAVHTASNVDCGLTVFIEARVSCLKVALIFTTQAVDEVSGVGFWQMCI